MEKLDILISKYKKQWKDIKNNTRSINKGSNTKLYWNYLNISVEIDDTNIAGKNNTKYFYTFIQNLNSTNTINDIQLFDNIIELITYFLLINPQILSEKMNFSSTIDYSFNFNSGMKSECIWHLIGTVFETFTRSLVDPAIKLKNSMYDDFFLKIVDTLTDNWLQIAVDIYGSSLESMVDKNFQDCLIDSYFKLTKYINDEQEENYDINDFINLLIEECFFLTVIINQNSFNKNIHIINQHLRVVLYLYDGLTEYLHQTTDEYSILLFEYSESIDQHNQACEKLWFILGYFVKLLERYYMLSNATHLNVDNIQFTLDFVKCIMELVVNCSFSCNDTGSKISEFESTFAKSLHNIFDYIYDKKCDLIHLFKSGLKLFLKNPSLYCSLPLQEVLVEINTKMQNNKENSVNETNVHFIESIARNTPNIKSSSQLFSQWKDTQEYFLFKVKETNSSVNEIGEILSLVSNINCEYTSDGKCLICDYSENYFNHKFKCNAFKRQQTSNGSSYSMKILKEVLANTDTKKIDSEITLHEGLLILLLRTLSHNPKIESLWDLTLLCEPENQNQVNADKLSAAKKIWYLISSGFEASLVHIKQIASQILVLLVSTDSTTDTKLTKFVLKYLSQDNSKFSIPIVMETISKITLNADNALPLRNILLLKHLDYIQNSFPAIKSDLAWSNLNYISKITDEAENTYQLLLPVLPTVTNADVLKLDKNITVFKNLAILTGRPFGEFLSRFLKYLIPSEIITYYKKDLIKKIADEIGIKKEEIIGNSKLKSKIVSYVIANGNCYNSKKVLRVLRNISPDFYVKDLRDFDYYLVIAEIVQLYSNPDSLTHHKQEMSPDLNFTNQLTLIKSFYYASLIQFHVSNESHTIEDIEKRIEKIDSLQSFKSWPFTEQELFYSFLENAIIGILHSLITILCDTSITTISYDKVKAIDGLTIIIIAAKPNQLKSVLPQVVMGLRTGLESLELRNKSLKAWFFVLVKLGIQPLEYIIDIPIAFFQKHWDYLSDMTRDLFMQFTNQIFKHEEFKIPYWTLMNFFYDDKLKVLERYPQKFSQLLRTKGLFLNKIEAINDHFQQVIINNDCFVVERNLKLLELQLMKEADIGSINDEQVDGILIQICFAVLDLCYRYQTSNLNINLLSVNCLSLLTTKTPTMLKIQMGNTDEKNKIRTKINQVYDFSDQSTRILFMKRLIKYVLVPAFWIVKTPIYQSYISFVIQEFLKLSKLSKSDENSHTYRAMEINEDLNRNFTDLERNIIEPMRSSEFMITSNFVNYIPLRYPLYKKTMSVNNWLNLLIPDLIRRLAKNLNCDANPIFINYLQLNKCHEESIFFETIFPYVIAQVIMDDDGKMLNDWKLEVNHIFSIDLSVLNKHQAKNLGSIYDNIFNAIDYIQKLKADLSNNVGLKNDNQKAKIENLGIYINKILFGGSIAKKALDVSAYERSVLYMELAYRQNKSKMTTIEWKNNLNIAFSNMQELDALDGVEQFFTTNNSLDDKMAILSKSSSNWELAKECFDELNSGWSGNTSEAYEILSDNKMFGDVVQRLAKFDYADLIVQKDNNNISLNEASKISTIALKSTILESNLQLGNRISRYVELVFSHPNANLLLNYSLNNILSNSDNKTALDNLELAVAVIGQRYISEFKAMTSLKLKDIVVNLDNLGLMNIMKYNKALGYETDASDSGIYNRYKDISGMISKKKLNQLVDFSTIFDTEVFAIILLSKLNVISPSEVHSKLFDFVKQARKNHKPEIAIKYLMKWYKSMNTDPKESLTFDFEYSKILWEAGEKEYALNIIKDYSDKITCKKLELEKTDDNLKLFSAIIRKYTQWCDMLNRKSPTELIDQHLTFIEMGGEDDNSYFELGLYYDRYYQQRQKTIPNKTEEDEAFDHELIINAIKYLLQSLTMTKQKKIIKEALPKVVILWLDTVEKLSIIKEDHPVIKTINKMIKKAIIDWDPNFWYTVILQLISRILVPNKEARDIIIKILIAVFVAYPDYIVWYIVVLYNNRDEYIKQAGNKILQTFLKKTNKAGKLLVKNSKLVIDDLSSICLKRSPENPTNLIEDYSLDHLTNTLPISMAVPIQQNFAMMLPEVDLVDQMLVSIHEIYPEYSVFRSLKKPKKITIKGNNGKHYYIICKKEDVRQDDQYMQFAQTMKYVLTNDVEASKRKMSITTYYIMPLHETYGIIEMVPSVVTIRSILTNIYDNKNLQKHRMQYLRQWNKFKKSDTALKQLFDQSLSIFKPVLYEWFLTKFPDPAKWYNCKNSFSRSYAVMCMVGFILGLGDRHFDNILISEIDGSVLHVDFDCLFEKGLDLPVPELVPFRLTNNIVDCLGITNVEGVFRKACEISMNLIRENEIMLLNEFEMMMIGRMKSLEQAQKYNTQSSAQSLIYVGREGLSFEQILEVIRNKMRGIDPKDSVTVSVAAQVEYLLKTAQDQDLLYKMYSGWMPIW
ncbi:hypothetical protein ACO0R3_000620 [Hanseniaspora guilliermondii]